MARGGRVVPSHAEEGPIGTSSLACAAADAQNRVQMLVLTTTKGYDQNRVQMLESRYAEEEAIVTDGLACIWAVLLVHGPTPVNHYCRVLAHASLCLLYTSPSPRD